MRINFLAVLIVIFLCSVSIAAEPSSILDFNQSVTFDKMGNNWTLHGNPTLEKISGKTSLRLDGESYLQANDTKPFDFDGEFTISAWVYPEKWVTDSWGGGTFTVFSRWKHGIRTIYLVNLDKVDENNATMSFYSDFMGTVSIKSKSTIPLNKWTHVAVTRDENNIVRIFINGNLEGEKVITHNFASTDYPMDYPMTIGASSNAMRMSVGYIDDWAVYKTCLYKGNFRPSEETKTEKMCNCNCSCFSTADEIRKFKSLLDDGIITQEEFNTRKKILLEGVFH